MISIRAHCGLRSTLDRALLLMDVGLVTDKEGGRACVIDARAADHHEILTP
jgi:hypothetical protein